MSRKYEAFYIIRPDLKDADANALIERFKKVVTDGGGTIIDADRWDRRKLAYEIKGHKEGVYILMNFDADAATQSELGRLMRISDDVIRHTILKNEAPEGSAPVSANPAPIEEAQPYVAPANRA